MYQKENGKKSVTSTQAQDDSILEFQGACGSCEPCLPAIKPLWSVAPSSWRLGLATWLALANETPANVMQNGGSAHVCMWELVFLLSVVLSESSQNQTSGESNWTTLGGHMKKKLEALTDAPHQAPFSSQDHRSVMWVRQLEEGTLGLRRAVPANVEQKQDPPWKACPNGRITSKYVIVVVFRHYV